MKHERQLHLLRSGKVIKSYKLALGGAPVGHKEKQGDQKTPEGLYIIDSRNPNSQFHKSLHISYPNAADRARARRLKVHPGGDIFIHGLGKAFASIGKDHSLKDWTLGCIAVTNEEIEEIWRLVPNGTPIEIKP
ncbi:MAG TPA: L,D-transpeptidase family protein [Terriglobales bacterium]|nr:L,D-transpeptidase family protein [Terriglobales bacterium]